MNTQEIRSLSEDEVDAILDVMEAFKEHFPTGRMTTTGHLGTWTVPYGEGRTRTYHTLSFSFPPVKNKTELTRLYKELDDVLGIAAGRRCDQIVGFDIMASVLPIARGKKARPQGFVGFCFKGDL